MGSECTSEDGPKALRLTLKALYYVGLLCGREKAVPLPQPTPFMYGVAPRQGEGTQLSDLSPVLKGSGQWRWSKALRLTSQGG